MLYTTYRSGVWTLSPVLAALSQGFAAAALANKPHILLRFGLQAKGNSSNDATMENIAIQVGAPKRHGCLDPIRGPFVAERAYAMRVISQWSCKTLLSYKCPSLNKHASMDAAEERHQLIGQCYSAEGPASRRNFSFCSSF